MEQILNYLKKYNPLAIIVYGSYADGSATAESDFDVLVISKDHAPKHDVSFVENVELDAFIYPLSHFEGEVDYADWLQIAEGNLVLDSDGIGRNLKDKVQQYLETMPLKSSAEIEESLAWCKKMMLRMKKADAEGMYRRHRLVVDSLEIYCDIMMERYLGSKKTLRKMRQENPIAYNCYSDALIRFDTCAIEGWICWFIRLTLPAWFGAMISKEYMPPVQ